MPDGRVHLTDDQIITAIADPDDDIITIKEAANMCGVTRECVAKWIARGRLPVRVVNGRSWLTRGNVVDVEHATRTAGNGGARRNPRAWSMT